MNIQPISSTISKNIHFGATQNITKTQRHEANKEIDDIRKQISELDKSLTSDISKINSAEKEIKEDGERQISVLEKEKDDLRKQTNKDKTTLQKRIDDLQNQYDV